MIKTFHIIADTSEDKYTIMDIIRKHGGKITDVAGYGSRYIIHNEIEEADVPAIDKAIAEALSA